MITIKEVAEEAGVSITTVSRVMNNRGYISQKTVRAVNKAIETLGYHPNHRARAFSSKKTHVIGVIFPDVTHPFFGELIWFIEQYAYEEGYALMVCNSEEKPDKEQLFINMLNQQRMDGIIMGSHALDTTQYKALDRPVVTFERYINDKIPYVTCDNYTGGLVATKHLIEKGCRSLLFLSGPLKLDVYANQRMRGFSDACEQGHVSYEWLERDTTDLNYVSAKAFIQEKIMGDLSRFDGVFCSSDMLAYALYTCCQFAGVRVPEDLKIVGFDYDKVTRVLEVPKLTTVAQPIEAIARSLVRSLIDLIDNKDQPVNLQLGVRLIQGRTT